LEQKVREDLKEMDKRYKREIGSRDQSRNPKGAIVYASLSDTSPLTDQANKHRKSAVRRSVETNKNPYHPLPTPSLEAFPSFESDLVDAPEPHPRPQLRTDEAADRSLKQRRQ
jgi:hypothetical protein